MGDTDGGQLKKMMLELSKEWPWLLSRGDGFEGWKLAIKGKQILDFDNWPLNPLSPTSDQDRISPYNINTISTR